MKTKQQLVLDFIAESAEGVSTAEIQDFIIGLNHPDWDPDEIITKRFWSNSLKGYVECKVRRRAGYWGHILYGTGKYHNLLRKNCVQLENKKWILKKWSVD